MLYKLHESVVKLAEEKHRMHRRGEGSSFKGRPSSDEDNEEMRRQYFGVEMINEWTSGVALAPDILVVNINELSVEPCEENIAEAGKENSAEEEANEEEDLAKKGAEDETITAVDNQLLRFVSKVDRSRLRSTTLHLVETKRSEIIHRACSQLSRRVVHDLGWRAGTEFRKMHGEELVKAVLLRARDTAKGLQAVTEDMLKLSTSLRDAVITTRNAAPRVAAANKSRMRIRASMPSWLNKYVRGDVVDNAWQMGTDVVGVVTEVPWRFAGLMLNAMCGRDDSILIGDPHKDTLSPNSAEIPDSHSHANFDEWGGKREGYTSS